MINIQLIDNSLVCRVESTSVIVLLLIGSWEISMRFQAIFGPIVYAEQQGSSSCATWQHQLKPFLLSFPLITIVFNFVLQKRVDSKQKLAPYYKGTFCSESAGKMWNRHRKVPKIVSGRLFPVCDTNCSNKMLILTFFCVNKINLFKVRTHGYWGYNQWFLKFERIMNNKFNYT